MSAERVLVWYCRKLLARHQFLVLGTAGREGLPHLAQVAYRQEGDDLYVRIAPGAAVLGDLGAVGPVAGLLPGAEGHSILVFTGAAEAVAAEGERARIAALFTSEVSAADPESAIYRVTIDEMRPRRGTLEARTAEAGEVIMRQGEMADAFYVILAGSCEVIQEGARGRETLATLGPGQHFGETGLLAGVPRTASVTATSPTSLLGVSRATFAAALNDIAPTAAGLARTLYDAAQG
jgi:hypothetical protein